MFYLNSIVKIIPMLNKHYSVFGDFDDITEILLKVALNTINQPTLVDCVPYYVTFVDNS